MKGKVIVCRCEDVTLKDVLGSIDHGYDDIEEIKRYTGFGTGPCQGKECLAVIATVLAERTGRAPGELQPFTARPPLSPTPLKHYAALDGVGPPDAPGEADGHARGQDGPSAEPGASGGS